MKYHTSSVARNFNPFNAINNYAKLLFQHMLFIINLTNKRLRMNCYTLLIKVTIIPSLAMPVDKRIIRSN